MFCSKPDYSFHWPINLCADAIEIYVSRQFLKRPRRVPNPVFGAQQTIFFASHCKKDYGTTGTCGGLRKTFGESFGNCDDCGSTKSIVRSTGKDSTAFDSVCVIVC